jgi:hypothetical protein
MSRKNRNTLADRVIKGAEAALATQDYMSPIDVLVGIGWLDPGSVERWRREQIDCLERVVQTDLIGSHEAVPILGNRKRIVRKPDALCHAHATTPDAALQPKRRPYDRGAIPDPLGFARAHRPVPSIRRIKGRQPD